MKVEDFAMLVAEHRAVAEAYYQINRRLDAGNARTIVPASGPRVVPIPIGLGYFDHGKAKVDAAEFPLVVRGHRLSAFLREEKDWLEAELKRVIAEREIEL